MSHRLAPLIFAIPVVILTGCSGTNNSTPAATLGGNTHSSSGSATNAGGVMNPEATSGTGAPKSTGGTTPAGGASSAVGSNPSNAGNSATGGNAATGGNQVSGGSAVGGGIDASVSGGRSTAGPATGGAAATGGSIAAGGATNSIGGATSPPDVTWVKGTCSTSTSAINFETAEFCVSLTKASQTVASLQPKLVTGFDFAPADLVASRSTTPILVG